jgi:hypothetical protein
MKMIVSSDIPITVTPEEVLLAQYLGRRRTFPPPIMESARRAIAMGQGLFSPATVYDEFAVEGIEGDELLLDAGGGTARLRIGPKIDLLRPAGRVMAAVNTIGPALEEQVSKLHASGEALDAYMLDSVGVVALGAVGEAMRRRVESRALELGWGVSPALAPGSLVGWPLRGQRDLCGLLPLEAIGVQLNPHHVLEPHKSASTLVGLGPDYSSRRVGSVCRFCALAETCWRRGKDSLNDCSGD